MIKKLVFSSCLALTLLGAAIAFAADQPEIFIQMGHQKTVGYVAFSPDGEHAATGSLDMTVKLWHIGTGTEIRTYAGNTQEITAVAVSSGARWIASGDKKGGIRIWDAASGRQVRTLTVNAKEPRIACLAFAPDGRTISSVSWDATLRIWDVSTGQILKTVGQLGKSYFVSAGDYFVPVRKEYQKYAVVNIVTGQETATVERDLMLGYASSFSRDGRYGLFRKYDYNAKRSTFELFDLREQRTVSSWQADGDFQPVLSPDGRTAVGMEFNSSKVWDAQSGRQIMDLSKQNIQYAAFSPDSKSILTTGVYVPALWDIRTGNFIRELFRRPLSDVYGAMISPDGRRAVVPAMNAPPVLWDIDNTKLLKVFKGYQRAYGFSNDGDHLFLGKDKIVELWSINGNGPSGTYAGAAILSRDGRLIAEASAKEARVSEVSTGKLIRSYGDSAGGIQSISLSSDNRYLAVTLSKAAKRIDLQSGREETILWSEPYSSGASLSRDGRYLAVRLNPPNWEQDPRIVLYDVDTGREVFSQSGIIPAAGFTFSPDGSKLLYAVRHAVILCDVAGGRILHRLSGHTETIWHVSFSPRGDRIISGGMDKTIRLWDVASGRALRTFTGHDNSIRQVVMSEDGNRLLSSADDQTVRLWNVVEEKEKAKFLSFTDGEWIIITPEGYYNASAGGDKYLTVRIGNQAYGIDNYRESFFRPDLVKLALSGGSLKDFRSLADVKQPPAVKIVDTPAAVGKDEVTVRLSLTDQGGGIGDIRLYLNGTAVVMDSRAVLIRQKPGNAVMKAYPLKLAAGKNMIRAVAFNADNSMQSHEAVWEVTATFTQSRKPSLSALVIGINEFKNPKLKLQYPVADARLFATTLKSVSQGLFDRVTIRTLTLPQETTAEAILREIKSFQSLRPDDLFVFYIASHGTVDEGEYFLITSNVGSLRTEKLKIDAISQHKLKDAVANIPATKKLIIIDTCNAGALGEAIQVAMMTRGMSEDTALKILSRAMGSTILSASTSLQEALEGYKGHGLFTYVLTEGLKGKADKGKTGYVKTTELADYVDNEVPALAEKVFKRAQYPTISISGQAFPVGKVK